MDSNAVSEDTEGDTANGKGAGEVWDSDWRRRARCVGQTDLFFATTSAVSRAQAVAVCAACTVQTECLAVALDSRATHGIFAGTTPQWRNELLQRRPAVPSWRDLLLRARAEYRRRHRTPHTAACALSPVN
ncbi:WhiB family transcriptional regulator [Streptomyces sp. NPDC051555]|uniref:WhiB family transcriptional regulator n=1 Tax=Streptomyces sp. NPDC051555 TaxID=3365657 RepID=UPI0037A4A7E3